MRYMKDLPPSVADKVALLTTYKDELARLKEKCEDLEEELISYELHTSIDQFPPEIVLIIFEYYLLENPRVIRRLLLVSKLWYSTAVSSPRLWTRIPVDIPRDKADISHTYQSIAPRIRAFVKRSGKLLLDVSFMVDIEYNYTIHQWNPDHPSRLMELLIGSPDGDAMKRWRSLVLNLPISTLGNSQRAVLRLLRHPTPHLSRLVLHTRNCGLSFNPHIRLLPNLSSLKELTIDNHEQISGSTIPSGQISRLTLWCSFTHEWQKLAPFQSLRFLIVDGRYFPEADVLSATNFVLCLPLLEELILKNRFNCDPSMTLDFPSLRSLHMITGMASIGDFPVLPAISPRVVAWNVPEQFRPDWAVGRLQDRLETVLRQYDKMEELTVSEHAEEDLDTVFDRLERSGRLPPLLNRIRIVSDRDSTRLVRIRTVQDNGRGSR